MHSFHTLFAVILKTTCQSINKTDERESPQESKPASENSSLGLIEAVHQRDGNNPCVCRGDGLGIIQGNLIHCTPAFLF